MRANGVHFRGTVLEIGSGWFPIAGIVARLAGAERVFLTDITPHMDQQTFLTARQIVLDRLDEVATRFDIDPNAARGRLIDAGTPKELELIYLTPFDITAVPDGLLDLVISRACLEHIPVPDLEVLMAGLRPKLKRNGFMAHAIDNSDHFSHIDPTVSRVNFLTWSEAKHRLIWQFGKGGENRLRHHEYADLFRRAGYAVVGADALIDGKVLEDLSTLNMSAPYNCMRAEQIAAVTSWYVLKARG
ncbi:MAG: class I SAM-dependent methyltransferase [Stellaceae bacterium]